MAQKIFEEGGGAVEVNKGENNENEGTRTSWQVGGLRPAQAEAIKAKIAAGEAGQYEASILWQELERLEHGQGAQPGWVNARKELPEDDSDVFAAVLWIHEPSATEHYVIHDCSYYEGGTESGQKIFSDCEGEEFDAANVDYWIYKYKLAEQLAAPPQQPQGQPEDRLETKPLNDASVRVLNSILHAKGKLIRDDADESAGLADRGEGEAARSLPSADLRMLFFYIRNLSHEAWRDPKNAEALFRRIEGYAIKGYEALSSDKVSKEAAK